MSAPLLPEPPPTPEETVPDKKLTLYRVAVRVSVGSGAFELKSYWVMAPTQCSAAKHTALRDEVEDISMIEMWSRPLPEGASITFTTYKECP